MAATNGGGASPDSLAVRIGEALLRGAGRDGVFACDGEGRIVYCDAAASRFLRLGRRRRDGRRLSDLLAPAGEPTLELRFASALLDPSPVEFVVPRPGADDEWTHVRGLPIEGGMAFILADVTQQERSERSLRRKERRLRAANDSLRLAHQAARAATWEWRAGRSLRWLDAGAARALVGLPPASPGEETAEFWNDFVVPEDRPIVEAGLATLARDGEAAAEYRVAAVDGSQIWVRSSALVVDRRSDGSPARIVGITLDITPQKRTETRLQQEVQERRRIEERQQLLIHELNHRVKNMLATVQSVARQSLGGAHGAGPLEDFENRLLALAWAHDVLTRERWVDASLRTVLTRTLAPYDERRLTLSGRDLRISPKMALALAMGVHELATNAVKYGALSVPTGLVDIQWRLDAPAGSAQLVLEWRERDGPVVEPPTRQGFGTRLLQRGLAHELGGEVLITFAPAGLQCSVRAPFEAESPSLGLAPAEERVAPTS
ncbi:MAG: sensor histidine kinase [Pseudomonadota bacterium]